MVNKNKKQFKLARLRSSRYGFILLCLLHCHVNSAAERPDDVVKIAAGEWAPFVSQSLNRYGVSAHIIEAAFAYSNTEVEFGFFPWKRSLALSESGEWHGTMPWLMTEERKEKYYYTDTIIQQAIVLMHHKDLKISWQKLEDLKSYRFGGVRGYVYGAGFEEAESAGVLKVGRTTTDEQSIKKLKHGRIDIFLVERNVATDLIKKNFTDAEKSTFVFNDKALSYTNLYLLISKSVEDAEVIVNRFNNGLRVLRDSGEYDTYLKASLKGKYETIVETD